MYGGEIWFLLDRDTTKPALYNPGDRGMKSLVCEGLDISGVNKRNEGEKWGEGDGGGSKPTERPEKEKGGETVHVGEYKYIYVHLHTWACIHGKGKSKDRIFRENSRKYLHQNTGYRVTHVSAGAPWMDPIQFLSCRLPQGCR